MPQFYIIPETRHATAAGETLDEAKAAYLEAIAAHGSIDVMLVEHVPVIMNDLRGAMASYVQMGERIKYVQLQMAEQGWSIPTVASWVSFGEDSLRKLLTGEEVKARWVSELHSKVKSRVGRKKA